MRGRAVEYNRKYVPFRDHFPRYDIYSVAYMGRMLNLLLYIKHSTEATYGTALCVIIQLKMTLGDNFAIIPEIDTDFPVTAICKSL